MTRFLTLLWHRGEPVGICVFVSPPISLRQRNLYFGRTGCWNKTALKTLCRQLVLLQRVVIHPTYRGAGIATSFVRRSCALCPAPWIETLSQMGHINPFFERAGFTRVGVSAPRHRSRQSHSKIYGGNRQHGQEKLVSQETFEKSRHTSPVYYIFDNRPSSQRQFRND